MNKKDIEKKGRNEKMIEMREKYMNFRILYDWEVFFFFIVLRKRGEKSWTFWVILSKKKD